MNKVLKIIGVVMVSISVLALLGFMGSIRSSAICETLEVAHARESAKNLVAAEDIEGEILGIFPDLIGSQLNKINTRKIEEYTKGVYHVEDARVYKTIDRKLVVEIRERQPIIRLIDQKGISAYIDTKGSLLPVSVGPPQRLPVVSGAFSLNPDWIQKRVNVRDSICDPILADIEAYSKALIQSDFWVAQLQHTVLSPQGDFIAHPQVGNHTINFGDAQNIDQKLNQLKLFYEKGLNSSNWNKYRNINLKYKDQIVCTKK
jgi:cell division protein FtsQ